MSASILCIYTPEVTSKSLIERLAEACYSLTPRLAIREGEALFLDLSQSPNPMTHLQSLAKTFQSPLLMARASDVSTAWAMAVSQVVSPEALSVDALKFWVSPFRKNQALEEKVARMSLLFKKMGFSKLQDVRQIPLKNVTSRFDSESIQVLSSFYESKEVLWPLWAPQEQLKETLDLRDFSMSQGEWELEGLVFVLKTLLDRFTARLKGRAQKVTKFELTLRFESRASSHATRPRTFIFDFPTPQHTASRLVLLLRERLSQDLQTIPLKTPLIQVEVTALETAPTQGLQSDLLSKKEEDLDSRNHLVARLWQKLGEGRVFKAEITPSFVPEKTWIRTHPTAQKPLTLLKERLSSMNLRPSRLLKQPIPLLKESNQLICLQGWTHWSIQSWLGPERMQSHWWTDELKRDYFHVETQSGEKLWVYQDLKANHPERYFLHGFFD